MEELNEGNKNAECFNCIIKGVLSRKYRLHRRQFHSFVLKLVLATKDILHIVVLENHLSEHLTGT